MSYSSIIRDRVLGYKISHVFSSGSFKNIPSQNIVDLALSRLCKQGITTRLSKGLYIRTVPGQKHKNDPDPEAIIDAITDGHVGGEFALVKLGIQKVISNNFVIIGNRKPRRSNVAGLNISFRKKKTEIKTRHKNLLLLLESLKFLRKTSSSDLSYSISRLKVHLGELSIDKRLALVRLALRYSPFTRAILGALLEELDPQACEVLWNSLNRLTYYKIDLNDEILPNRRKWNLI